MWQNQWCPQSHVIRPCGHRLLLAAHKSAIIAALSVQAVEAAKFGVSILHKILWIERFAGHAANYFVRSIRLPIRIHLFPQPVWNKRCSLRRQALIKIWEDLPQLVVDLRSIQVAQRIGGEVAKRAARPVNILQHAQGVRWWNDTQVIVILLVPEVRQVVYINLPTDESLFQLKADDNMQVIGDFIGFSANETRPDLVERADKLLHLAAAKGLWEGGAQQVNMPLPEREGAANVVF